MNKKKNLPKFKNEDEERDFWASHSPLDYQDNFKPIDIKFGNLKPSRKSITLRVPEDLILSIKTIANKKDVPYQSLMKVWMQEKVKEEYKINRKD
ncbi:hypothetical protein GF389_05470 [Candidatus Dojkabacteria bacterium]|nr:hypothetical protein [Candidatus Dojkabacteria bacterium]